MPRFIYHATCQGVGGRITRPLDDYVDCKAACVLSTTGGKASAKSGSYKIVNPDTGALVLAWDSVESNINGEESEAGAVTTVIETCICGFNVEDVLKVDEIHCRLTLNYDTSGRRVSIDTEGSKFTNLTISGKPFDVRLDHAMGRDASDYQEFRRARPEIPEFQGCTHYSLGQHSDLKFSKYDFGYHDVPDFGRIYFAEWNAAAYTQGLSMLRLELGSPVVGKLVVGGGSGNGKPYP